MCVCVLQVMEDGQLSVLNLSPAPSTLKQDEEEPEEEEDREMARINAKHREHCPRWDIYMYMSCYASLKPFLCITVYR